MVNGQSSVSGLRISPSAQASTIVAGSTWKQKVVGVDPQRDGPLASNVTADAALRRTEKFAPSADSNTLEAFQGDVLTHAESLMLMTCRVEGPSPRNRHPAG